jgi:hypothetical protein
VFLEVTWVTMAERTCLCVAPTISGLNSGTGQKAYTSQTASPMWSLHQLLREGLMPFNLIDDLPGSPIG